MFVSEVYMFLIKKNSRLVTYNVKPFILALKFSMFPEVIYNMVPLKTVSNSLMCEFLMT